MGEAKCIVTRVPGTNSGVIGENISPEEATQIKKIVDEERSFMKEQIHAQQDLAMDLLNYFEQQGVTIAELTEMIDGHSPTRNIRQCCGG